MGDRLLDQLHQKITDTILTLETEKSACEHAARTAARNANSLSMNSVEHSAAMREISLAMVLYDHHARALSAMRELEALVVAEMPPMLEGVR